MTDRCGNTIHSDYVTDHRCKRERGHEGDCSFGVTPTQPTPEEQVEALARKFHEIYQAEAKRQGDVRHHDDYDELPENVKEFDRVLASYVLTQQSQDRAELTVAYDFIAYRGLSGNFVEWSRGRAASPGKGAEGEPADG